VKTRANIEFVFVTGFYSVLRAIPPVLGSQFPGVVGMFSALLILLALPWLDRSKVKYPPNCDHVDYHLLQIKNNR
jgi:quinol-cytochrome oxidoreductase complex cytochrome b subunit